MAAPTAAMQAVTQVSKPRNTLRVLRASLYGVSGLVLLLFLTSAAGAYVHRRALETIGTESAPSIIAAQKIRTALAGMDTSAANDLLASNQAESDAARHEYEQSRLDAAQALIDAARHISYGGEEREPLEKIQMQLGYYEALIQRARDLHDQKDPRTLDAYARAASLVDNDLLPAADELDKANFRRLDEAYARQGGYSIGSRVLVLLFGIALLGGLLWLQSFITNRTRRILNLPLLAATLIALAFTLWVLMVFGTEEHELKTARQDAFTSIRALWKARAAALSAAGDGSRFLLRSAKLAGTADDFQRNVNSLILLPSGVMMQDVARDGLNENSGATGYLADEIHNITFPREREPAVETTAKFAQYLAIDGEMRRLEAAGKHTEAVALRLGSQPSQAEYAFNQLDDALGRTLAVNQRAFDDAIKTGFSALSHFEAKAAVAALLIVLLVFAGLAPRIAEYR
jgi:hypothetical protein